MTNAERACGFVRWSRPLRASIGTYATWTSRLFCRRSRRPGDRPFSRAQCCDANLVSSRASQSGRRTNAADTSRRSTANGIPLRLRLRATITNPNCPTYAPPSVAATLSSARARAAGRPCGTARTGGAAGRHRRAAALEPLIPAVPPVPAPAEAPELPNHRRAFHAALLRHRCCTKSKRCTVLLRTAGESSASRSPRTDWTTPERDTPSNSSVYV